MNIEESVKVVLDSWFEDMTTYLRNNGYPLHQTLKVGEDICSFEFASYGFSRFSISLNKKTYSSIRPIPPEILAKLKKIMVETTKQIKSLSSPTEILNARQLLLDVKDMLCNKKNVGWSEIKTDDCFIGIGKDRDNLHYYSRPLDGVEIQTEGSWPYSEIRSDKIPNLVIKNFGKLKNHVIKVNNWELTIESDVEDCKKEIRGILLVSRKKEEVVTSIDGYSLSYAGDCLGAQGKTVVIKKGYLYGSQSSHIQVFLVQNKDKIVSWIESIKKVSRKRSSSIYTRAQTTEAKSILDKAFKILDLHKIGYDHKNCTIDFKIDDIEISMVSTRYQYTQLRTDNAYFKVNGKSLGWPMRNIGTDMFVSAKDSINQLVHDNWDKIKEKAESLVDSREEDVKQHNEKVETQLKADFKEELLTALLDNKI